WLMMSLWDALRMNMMISYQELVRTFPRFNSDTYSPTPDEIRRFPSRATKDEVPDADFNHTPTLRTDNKNALPKLKPSRFDRG
ncbi:hypothetical protein MRO53_24345, partial [Escherichia coli]|nr:hypothetical protein [Escherichia coli]